MYDRFKDKEVKLIFKDGKKIATRKGIFIDSDNLNYMVEVNGKAQLFLKEDVSRIEEIEVFQK